MNDTLKCISLWQPWAALCVIGAKTFETVAGNSKFKDASPEGSAGVSVSPRELSPEFEHDSPDTILRWADAKVEYSDEFVNGEGAVHHEPEMGGWSVSWKHGSISFGKVTADQAKIAGAMFIYLWTRGVSAQHADHCAVSYAVNVKIAKMAGVPANCGVAQSPTAKTVAKLTTDAETRQVEHSAAAHSASVHSQQADAETDGGSTPSPAESPDDVCECGACRDAWVYCPCEAFRLAKPPPAESLVRVFKSNAHWISGRGEVELWYGERFNRYSYMTLDEIIKDASCVELPPAEAQAFADAHQKPEEKK